MLFKYPEILFLLLLLVIPILVHLFQLRRFKKEYFTNVRFLKELSIQTRKSSKVKKWLLLVTRLLLLTALILAFAQPFFKSKEKNHDDNEMYIVLDNSFSMQAKGKKGELLKRAIQDLLENTPEKQNFSLITNSQTYWDTDIKSIRKDLQNLNYSALSFQLESAMAKIKSRKTSTNKDVIIITDALGIKKNQFKSIDTKFNTYFLIPEAEQKNNVSIDSVFIKEYQNYFYEIGIDLTSYGEQKKEISVALYNQNRIIAKSLVKFKNQKTSVNFTIPKKDFNGYVSLNDASLEYDNIFYFNILKQEKTNVLSIGNLEKSNFLSKIYSSLEFNYINAKLETLDYNVIEKQNIIVLNEIDKISQALEITLKSFVEKGGNLIFIPSNVNKVNDLNRFLGIFGKVKFEVVEKTNKLITKIAFEHPLFNSVFEKKIVNFQYPTTKLSFGVSSLNLPILSYEDESIFLTTIKTQNSNVYVFTAPLNKENSNFQNSPLIVPIFYNMAQNKIKNSVCALVIGNNKPFIVNTSQSKNDIIDIKNASEKFIPIQQILNSKVKLVLNDYPTFAGNFGIYNKDKFIQNISFNYNRLESNLNQINSNLLSDYKIVKSVDIVINSLISQRIDKEVWKLFVLLSLLFLILEVLIQKFIK